MVQFASTRFKRYKYLISFLEATINNIFHISVHCPYYGYGVICIY